MNRETITCLYSCSKCKLKDQEFDVPIRHPDMDIKTWMEMVFTAALARDHNQRSPFCFPKKMKNVKIPVSGAKYVGGPAVH